MKIIAIMLLLPFLPSYSVSAQDHGRSKGYFCRAIGDSLTAGFSDKQRVEHSYPVILQTLGECGSVSNEGVVGQTSTQIAVRTGALPTTATITGGVIPASGRIGITFKPGYEPVSSYSAVGLSIRVNNVVGVVTHERGVNVFTRSAPGPEVASPPDSPVTIDQNSLNKGFVIIWAGKNNALQPDQVLSDVAAIVSSLPAPKRFVVLSVTNSDNKAQWRGGNVYKIYMALNASLQAAYPNNYLDIRSRLVAAYDPNNPEDVIDNSHDVIPSSIRSRGDFVLKAAIPDATSCTAIPAPANNGSSLQIEKEKIYVVQAWSNLAAADGCIRGFVGTAASEHAAGTPMIAIDPTHLDTAGQEIVAREINSWMRANERMLRGAATATEVSPNLPSH